MVIDLQPKEVSYVLHALRVARGEPSSLIDAMTEYPSYVTAKLASLMLDTKVRHATQS